jgi:imidazole glycerol-phosphate synthase subunit HisH
MIAIVDYGMGNLLSVYHALEMVGATARICTDPTDLREAERIVLPGVGAFRDCINNLQETGFSEALEEAVFSHGKPILGICLGMQVMARKSFENGEYHGLGWFAADVIRLHPQDETLRVPQIGWNEVTYKPESPLFMKLPVSPDFYFIHSYHMLCDDSGNLEATCDYGGAITAAVRKDNIFATQFHPEKSQCYGLRVLENFLRWTP